MAEHEYYLGTRGPFYYDTDDPILDVDGNDTGYNFNTIHTAGQITVLTAPTEVGHVIRKEDLDKAILIAVTVVDIADPSTELATIAGTSLGALVVATQLVASSNPTTLYAWDTSVDEYTSADIPFVVPGDGGYWIAIGGTYTTQDISFSGDINLVDGAKIYWGTGSDTYITFDGTSFFLYKGGVAVQKW